MLVLTTDTLPPNLEIKEALGLVMLMDKVQISGKGIIETFVQRHRNEQQEVFDNFVKSAPSGANIIYGVKLSTTSITSQEGIFIWMTYYGTAAVYKLREGNN